MRASGRRHDELREISIEPGAMPHAEGSCLIRVGKTAVLCSASVEPKPPPFLRGTGLGWVTAEYGMLPRATTTRNRREAGLGHPTGRSQEIQRLIGRSLRAAVDRRALGERQIVIDCDVLLADGGTRCAAITGGWVALQLACAWLLREGLIASDPVETVVAAVSCGIVAGEVVLDLDYPEDSRADVDGNFVGTSDGRLVEVQCSVEGAAMDRGALVSMLDLAQAGLREINRAQRVAVGA